jgi:hypothetical protein
MKKQRKTRWMVVTIAASLLFGIGAVRLFLRSDILGAVLYCVATIIFLLLTFAYAKGYLK